MPALLPILAGLGAKAIAAKYISSKIIVNLIAFGAAAAVSYVQYRSAKKKLRANIQNTPEGTTDASTTVTLVSSVAPSVWRIGEVRCTGYPVFASANDRDLYFVHVLSNGSINSIEKVWVQGEEVKLERSGSVLEPVSGSKYRGYLKIWEYFRADGDQGAEIRAIPNKDMYWNSACRLHGVSYCLVKVTQNKYGDDFDARVYTSIPRIEYLIKGLKLQYPTSSTTLSAPEYTTNAAKVIAWWLHERRGVDIENIDIGYLNSAISVCDQQIAIAGSSEYPGSVKRYQFNGSINANDNPVQVEEQMDMIINGGIVEWNGKHYIRPGAEQTSRLTITEDDIIGEPQVITAPNWRDRFNSASVTMQQSNLHDYLEHNVQINDDEVEDRDGMRLTRADLRLVYVNDPIQAYNIVHSLLLDARASLGLNMLCMPGDDFEVAKLIPGDKIKVTVPFLGLDEYEMRVLTNTLNQDMSVSLELDEWPSGLYTDIIKLPKLTERPIDIEKQADRPDGLTATSVREVGEDGSVTWRFETEWDDNGFQTELVLTGPGVLNGRARIGYDNNTDNTLTAKTHGDYTITARHYGSGYSGSLQVAVSVRAAREPLPAPVASGVEPAGRHLNVVFNAITRRDVSGVAFRYTRVPLSSTGDPSTIDADTWDDAEELKIESVVPSVGGTGKIRTSIPIPSSGKYCIAARFIDTVGELGAVAKLGIYIFELPAEATFNQQSWPLWEGLKNNMGTWDDDADHPCILLASPGSVTSVRKLHWNGSGGFPFGAPAGSGSSPTFNGSSSCYYETKPLDCETSSSSREVNITPEYVTPQTGSTAGTPQISVMYSATENGTYTVAAYTGSNQSIPSTARWVKARIWFDDNPNYKGLERLSLGVRNL